MLLSLLHWLKFWVWLYFWMWILWGGERLLCGCKVWYLPLFSFQVRRTRFCVSKH